MRLQLCLAAALSPRLVSLLDWEMYQAPGVSFSKGGPSWTILCPRSAAGTVFSVNSLH